MKIIKARFTLSIGFANAQRSEILDVEVDDNAKDDEIQEQLDEEWNQWASNYIDGGAWVIDE